MRTVPIETGTEITGTMKTVIVSTDMNTEIQMALSMAIPSTRPDRIACCQHATIPNTPLRFFMSSPRSFVLKIIVIAS